MANNVFANGLEIACKAASGKSVSAFPDPCWTPPPPKAGWILILYANTAYAKDTSNASKSVFITNKPVMKKDSSFFKTSTGNEPAAGPKGLHTGVKKGKAYFTSWSMNVKIEGENVDRHTDSITHNHGSYPANTAVWTYVDTAEEKKACEKDIKRVDQACSAKQKRRKGSRKSRQNDAGWKGEHCGILNFTPSSALTSSDKDEIAGLLYEFDLAEQALSLADEMFTKASDMVKDGLIDAATNVIPLKKLRKIDRVFNGVDGLIEIAQDMNPIELHKRSKEIANYIGTIRDQAAGILDQAGEVPQMLTDIYTGKDVEENLSKMQALYAVTDPCTRARKCLLQSFNQSKNKNTKSKLGCCPGQTGHHLIPKSYFGTTKDKKFTPDKGICPDYNEGKAPTVCVEGKSNKYGSHGALHTKTDRFAKKAEESTGNFSYETARDAVATAHRMQFPLSLCSPGCLKAQLDNYHTKACKGGSQNLMRKRTAADKEEADGGYDD